MLQLTEPAAYANQTKLFSMNCNSSSINNDNNKNKGNCSHPNLDAFLTCRRTSEFHHTIPHAAHWLRSNDRAMTCDGSESSEETHACNAWPAATSTPVMPAPPRSSYNVHNYILHACMPIRHRPAFVSRVWLRTLGHTSLKMRIGAVRHCGCLEKLLA